MSGGISLHMNHLLAAPIDGLERLAKSLRVDVSDRVKWEASPNHLYPTWRAVLAGRVMDKLMAEVAHPAPKKTPTKTKRSTR